MAKEMGTTTKIIPYSPNLDIRNLGALPRGLGARYLEVVEGIDGGLIAKQWRRRPIEEVTLIDMEAKSGIVEAKGKEPESLRALLETAPWQLTREQFVAQSLTRAGFSQREGKWYRMTEEGGYREVDATAYAERMMTEFEGGHKYVIEKALSEGKPVPVNVLADYPELAKRKLGVAASNPSRGAVAAVLGFLVIGFVILATRTTRQYA